MSLTSVDRSPANAAADALAEHAGSYMSLLEIHRELDMLFAEHQIALLERDVRRSARLLSEFTGRLREHIRLEEDVLLPIYARAGSIPGGGADLYLAEHRKLLHYLERFQARLAELPGKAAGAREIIALLDEESRFKDLMEHHDLRERNILYPVLDRVATEEEKRVCPFR